MSEEYPGEASFGLSKVFKMQSFTESQNHHLQKPESSAIYKSLEGSTGRRRYGDAAVQLCGGED